MTVSSGTTETKVARIRNFRSRRNVSLLVIALLVSFGTANGFDDPPATISPFVESRFRQAIDRPLIAGRSRVPLREILDRLAEERNVAVLLDRRIDPDQLISVTLNAAAFDLGLAEIAATVQADVSVVADTVFIAPIDCARTLRTRIDLIDEKRDRLPDLSVGRKFELVRRYPVSWEKLATPAEVLGRICDRRQLTIENPEVVEHDLWRKGLIAHANATESLMLVATQFGLEIEWVAADRVRFVPESENPAVERSHRPKGMTLTEAVQRIERDFPQVAVQDLGSALQVLGTVEDHERIAVLIGERPPRKAVADSASPPLARRRFTLRIEGLPPTALFEELRKQGIQVEFDARKLTEDGADLSVKLSLDLKQAPIEELLRQACTPAKIRFEIDGEKILLHAETR